MASKRIKKKPVADKRAAILRAATEIMRDEGYAAVSSRSIAQRAGVRSGLVHYYFKSMEEVFLTVYRAAEEQYYERQAKALMSTQPLRALWKLNGDSYNTKVLQELIALASHHDALRAEIARASQRSRTVQTIAFERALAKSPQKLQSIPPPFLSLLMTAAARLMTMDALLGVTAGHAEANAWIDELLLQLESA